MGPYVYSAEFSVPWGETLPGEQEHFFAFQQRNPSFTSAKDVNEGFIRDFTPEHPAALLRNPVLVQFFSGLGDHLKDRQCGQPLRPPCRV